MVVTWLISFLLFLRNVQEDDKERERERERKREARTLEYGITSGLCALRILSSADVNLNRSLQEDKSKKSHRRTGIIFAYHFRMF